MNFVKHFVKHFLVLLFYFPIVIVSFFYFAWNMNKLDDFYLMVDDLFDISKRAKKAKKAK